MTDERQAPDGVPSGTAGAATDAAAGFRPDADAHGRSAGAAARVVPVDLDRGAPLLLSPGERHLNRRVLALLALLAVLLAGIAYLVLDGTGRPAASAAARDERVTVTAAPRLALPLRGTPAVRTPAPVPLPAVEPIPFVASRPLPPLPATGAVPFLPRVRTLAERRGEGSGILVAATPDPGAIVPALAGSVPDAAPASPSPAARPSSARRLPHAGAVMPRGTFIRCVLETRVVSDVPGFTSCTVTERVYSFGGRRLLLPPGTRLQGTYDKGAVGHRMAVVWDRILTPDGIDVDMASPGTDPLGGAGLPGERNAHWGSRIGSALLISLLSDAFKYAAAERGPRTTTVGYGVVTQQPFESNTAQAIQELSRQSVRESANRPPTLTIRQGTLISVYVARDVDFSGVLDGR